MVKHRTKIIVMICLILLLVGIILVVKQINDLRPNQSGPEFEKHWKCDKYQISFVSDDDKFPSFHNYYNGFINMDDIGTNIVVYVGNGEFIIGNFGHEHTYGEDVDFVEYATGTYSYSQLFHTLTVRINTTNEEYSFLKSKTIVFTETVT